MAFELKFNTGLSKRRLETLILKLEKIAKLSDEINKKQIGPKGGPKFPQAGGAGGTERGTVNALALLNTSITRLTAVMSTGTGAAAVRGAGGVRGTRGTVGAKGLAEAHVREYKLIAAADAKLAAQMIERAHHVAGEKLKNIQRVRAARIAADASAQKSYLKAISERNKAAVTQAGVTSKLRAVKESEAQKSSVAEIRRVYRETTASHKSAGEKLKDILKLRQARKKAAAEQIRNVKKVENAEKRADSAKVHAVTTQAAAATRAGMYATGIGIGLFTAKTMIAAASAYALVAAMRSVVGAGAAFSEAIVRANAIMGANSEMAKENAAEVRKLAKTTIFTATETAEGLTYLAMAGLRGQEAIEALPGTLNLASIGMIDMALSADMATNVMNEFGKDSSDLNDIVNSMAMAVTSSNTTIQQLGQALSYVGPIAHATNTTLNETIAMISTMADSGVKGTRAGTALRRSISNLLSPTAKVSKELDRLQISVKNNYGEMRSMVDIMRDLAAATDDVGTLTRLFGVRAAPGMIAVWVDMKKEVKGTIPALMELKQAMEDIKGTKFAEEMRKDVESHLKGDWKLAVSAATEAALLFYDSIEGPLRDGLKSLTLWLEENANTWQALGEIAASTINVIVQGVRDAAGGLGLAWDLAIGDPLEYLSEVYKADKIAAEKALAAFRGEEYKPPTADVEKIIDANHKFLALYEKHEKRFARELKRMKEERMTVIRETLVKDIEAERALLSAKVDLSGEVPTIPTTSPRLAAMTTQLAAIDTIYLQFAVKRALEAKKEDMFLTEKAKILKELADLEKGTLDERTSAINKSYDAEATRISHDLALKRISAGEAANLKRTALNESKEALNAEMTAELRKLKTVEEAALESFRAIAEEKDKSKQDAPRLIRESQALTEARKERVAMDKEIVATNADIAEQQRALWREEEVRLHKKVETIDKLIKKETERNLKTAAQIKAYQATGKALNSEAEARLQVAIAAHKQAIAVEEANLKSLVGTKKASEQAIASTRTFINETKTQVQELEKILLDAKALNVQKKHVQEIAKIGTGAAQSLKKSFADFLFNPFEKGLKGMVLGFASAVHRMVTEAVAAQLIEKLFQGATGTSAAGFIGSLIGPLLGAPTAAAPVSAAPSMSFGAWAPRAGGGAVMSNNVYPINERGTEMLSMGGKDYLLTGNQSGQVTSNDKLKGDVIINNYVTVEAPQGTISQESLGRLQQRLNASSDRSRERYG